MKIHLIQMKIDELLAVCDEHNNDPGELINILHAAQGIFGYLPREVQEIIAGRLYIPVSKVYGVVTFYSFFTMTPKGKYPISVCLGTACYVRGAEKVLEEFQRQLEIKVGETTSDGLFSFGLSTLCGGLRTGSGRHDCRKSLWTSDTRESAGYPFRILPVGASISDSSVVPMLWHNRRVALAQLCRNDGTAI